MKELKYALLRGERPTPSFTVSLSWPTHEALEAECREAWDELHTVSDSHSPYTDILQTRETLEGRVYMMLLEHYFTPGTSNTNAADISFDESKRIWAIVQRRGRSARGRVAKFAERRHDIKAYRKFRSWWIEQRIAPLFGVEFNTPCPFSREASDAAPLTNVLAIAKQFEQWVDHKIPDAAWEYLRGWQAVIDKQQGGNDEADAAGGSDDQ